MWQSDDADDVDCQVCSAVQSRVSDDVHSQDIYIYTDADEGYDFPFEFSKCSTAIHRVK